MKNHTVIASDKNRNDNNESHQPDIKIGLSACLAGFEVRYNAGHKQSQLCLKTLSKHFSFKTFCPEVSAGFSTPRPTMRLIGNPDEPTLTYTKDSSEDLTDQLKQGFQDELTQLDDLDGYILMSKSPSCGLERVKVYQESGMPHQKFGMGLYAKALKEKYPLMPMEEEGRLHDDVLYDNFVTRVYAHHNFRKEVLEQPSIANLMQFHASYKYMLMAHQQKDAKTLGKLVASHKGLSFEELTTQYLALFMKIMSKPANRGNHTNALLHMLGYLKQSVSSDARQSIVDAIYTYNNGMTPLVTPLTLLKHYFKQYGSSYINMQRYLQPYPENIHPIRKYCR
ncbi:DUF523 and DUF1722 domain-containing protein [Marinomonas sp. C2222]|uniref:DUF523 and DUF1722 domain-containing protein n=1 Tax=Marinomonas sargassi TaxID=2984494 RepID=A0ABT2YUV9_9GAMM|nr:DUF523 and DUF1722 domain-containing protein [Marinomonas sargassi]MCV2403671.1 DUF523 and DUF1722 domain-containing protein [Marinomonas sargassi]